jgi:hypothetical protein
MRFMLPLVAACAGGDFDTAARPLFTERDHLPAIGATSPAAGEVVSRVTGLGESDLFLVRPGAEPVPLAPAEGPDDMPVALPDGRVAFVSSRTTIASIWIVDPRTGALRQLTNRGLRAGRSRDGFVPTPMRQMQIRGTELFYEASPGAFLRVDLETGRARSVSE